MKAANSLLNSFSDINVSFINTGSLNTVTELTENIHHFTPCITISVRQTITHSGTAAGETS
jgi:hypothetical protein